MPSKESIDKVRDLTPGVKESDVPGTKGCTLLTLRSSGTRGGWAYRSGSGDGHLVH